MAEIEISEHERQKWVSEMILFLSAIRPEMNGHSLHVVLEGCLNIATVAGKAIGMDRNDWMQVAGDVFDDPCVYLTGLDPRPKNITGNENFVEIRSVKVMQ